MKHKLILSQAFAKAETAQEAEEVVMQELEEDVAGDYYEAKAEVEDQEMAIEELEDTAEGLESLIAQVTASAENQALDATSARYLQAAADFALAPVGGKGLIQLPGQESFEEDGGAEAATTFAVESLKEGLGKVWNTIVEFIKSIGKKLVTFYQSQMALVGRVNKRAKALGAKAKDLKGTPKEKELKMGGSLQALAIDGKVSTDLSDTKMVVADALKAGDLADEALEYGKVLADSVRGKVELPALFSAATKFYADCAKAYGLTEEVKGDDRFGTNKVIRSKSVMGGDKAVFLVTKPATDKLPEYLVSFGVMTTVAKPKKLEAEAKVAALTAKEIADVAKEVEQITSLIIKSKIDDKEGEKMRQALINLGKDLVKEEEGGMKAKLSVKLILGLFRSLAAKMHKPKMDVMDTLVRSADAALNVAIKSSKNLTEGDAKKDDKEEEDKKEDDK